MHTLILTVWMMLFQMYGITPDNHAQAVTDKVVYGVTTVSIVEESRPYEMRAPVNHNPIQVIADNKDTRTTNTEYITTWEGGDFLDHDNFIGTIAAVVERLHFVDNNNNIVKLVLETAAIESDFGHNISPRSRSKGVFQFHTKTVKYLENEVFKKKPELAADVHKFYNKGKTLTWNIRYNLPYQIALTLAYYHVRAGSDLDSKITTQVARFQVYKKFFNTPLGASTQKTYREKSDNYVDYKSLGTQVLFT